MALFGTGITATSIILVLLRLLQALAAWVANSSYLMRHNGDWCVEVAKRSVRLLRKAACDLSLGTGPTSLSRPKKQEEQV